MIYVILVILAFITIGVLAQSKNIAHPVFLLVGIWCVVIFCASLRLYGMVDYSDSVILIIFVGLLSFCSGCFISYAAQVKTKKYIEKVRSSNEERGFYVNWKAAYFFLAFAFIGFSILIITTIAKLLSGVSYSTIHDMYYGYGNKGTLLPDSIKSFIQWISIPCLYASIFIALTNMGTQQKNKNYIFIVFLTTLMYVFGNASRIMLVIVVADIVFLMQFNKFSFSKKEKKIMYVFIVAALIIVMMFILLRKSSTNKVNTIYAYLSIPVPLFDYWLDDFNAAGEYLYGGAFFYGITSWLNYFTSMIGLNIPSVEIARSYIVATQDGWVTIFPGRIYNAFCTMFYYFYIDGGIVGVIIYDFIFGLLCYKLYYMVFVLRNKNALPYYFLIIQCVLFSSIRWQAGTQTFIVEMVALLFAIPPKYVRRKRKIEKTTKK